MPRRQPQPLVFALLALIAAACAGPATPSPTLAPPTSAPTLTAPPTGATSPSQPTATPTLLPASSPALSPTPEFDPFAVELPSADVDFSIPPAFQHVTEDSAILYFAFEQPAAGAVLYRAPGDATQTITYGADTASHLIALSGLRSGTTYGVAVAVGDEPDYALPQFMGTPWGVQTITTPPFPEPLRFAVTADMGFGDDTTIALMDRIAAARPDFVLVSGDIVYRGHEQRNAAEAYRLKYFRPMAPVLRQAPAYPAFGNHELDTPVLEADGISYYFTAFPPFEEPTYPAWNGVPLRKWYAFDFGGVQFLSLDSQALFGDPGRAEQDAWLAERLQDLAFSYTIPFFHISPYSSSEHQAEGGRVQVWAEQFEAAGVPLVISAHDHVYERLLHGGATYIISGGGSATVYRLRVPNEFSQFFASVSHFTLFEAYPDRIEVRAIGVDGTEIDRATIPVAR